MAAEVIHHLRCEDGKVYVDATAGGGGHTLAILESCGPAGQVICIDQDPDAIKAAKKRLKSVADDRYKLIQHNFAKLGQILAETGQGKIDGIVFDLGVSSYQIDETERGFAFDEDAPLDMRMGPEAKTTARELVNQLETSALAHIFRKYGEEHHSYKIARAIEQARDIRPVDTTGDLVSIIKRVTSGRDVVKTIARIFQALRIEINNELEVLKTALNAAVEFLNPGGRIVVLSYHSLEDRIVKSFFQDMERGCTCPPDFPYCVCNGVQKLSIVTSKVVRPTQEEIDRNSRSRSAKLRAAERCAEIMSK